jgi:hypothetical protein
LSLGGVAASNYATTDYVNNVIQNGTGGYQIIFNNTNPDSIDLGNINNSLVIILNQNTSNVNIKFPVNVIENRRIRIFCGDFQTNLSYNLNNGEQFENNAEVNSINNFQAIEYIYNHQSNTWCRIQ